MYAASADKDYLSIISKFNNPGIKLFQYTLCSK